MNNKQRIHAALAGLPTDRNPVTVLYNMLYHRDHFAELTGRPQWQYRQWLNSPPAEYVATYRQIIDQAPLEILQPDEAAPRATRERTEFLERQGQTFRRDRLTGELTPIAPPVSGHAFDDRPHETRHVFDKSDVDERMRLVKAEEMVARGDNDYLDAVVAALGQDNFILSGGVIGAFYACSWQVGLTNLLSLVLEEPDLIEYIEHKQLEQNIESIRQLAAAGGDAIYIDDAMATGDMISRRHYERFSLPYMQEMVREIHRLGHQAIVIYFGGVADRLDLIAEIGADGLAMETSMKGYVNDIGQVAGQIGQRVTLFGNVDPVNVLERADDATLAAEMRRQAEAGRGARGFIMCTGSPITPGTPLARVRKFVELGQALR